MDTMIQRKYVFFFSLLLSLYVFVECLAEILACSHHQFPKEKTRDSSDMMRKSL